MTIALKFLTFGHMKKADIPIVESFNYRLTNIVAALLLCMKANDYDLLDFSFDNLNFNL